MYVVGSGRAGEETENGGEKTNPTLWGYSLKPGNETPA
jgi:hypothetical protein